MLKRIRGLGNTAVSIGTMCRVGLDLAEFKRKTCDPAVDGMLYCSVTKSSEVKSVGSVST
jgi:hypothetical protein